MDLGTQERFEDQTKRSIYQLLIHLNRHEFEYMLIGGTAVSYYGYTRVSGVTLRNVVVAHDFDFWYKPIVSNFYKLISAIKDIGYYHESLDDIIFDPQKTFLKIPTPTYHIDFLPQMTGIDSFQECFKRATKETLFGQPLHIIGLNDLMMNKEYLNRPVDEIDVKELKQRKLNAKSQDKFGKKINDQPDQSPGISF